MTILPSVIETRSKMAATLVMWAILSLSVTYTVNAQTNAKQAENQTDVLQHKRAGKPLGPATVTTRTSPFSPPEDSDHSFSTDDAPKLDTGCIFRSSGPIVFNIEIKRFIGQLKADGTLADADKLIRAGALSPTVKLIMPGFDVDSSAVVQGAQPERDRVSVNGQQIGFLQGQNNQWILNSFEVDIRKIKFAERGTNGSAPTGGVNEIRIDIDTANSDQVWCTSVDWGSTGFRALSPIILIHGNNSDDDFYVRQGFTQELDGRGIVYDNNVFGDSQSPSRGQFISVIAALLNNSIPRIARSFGAKTVHLVAHSKGGLDARAYLASYQPQHNSDFKVISLTTLSTPHNGSVLADVSIDRINAIQQVGTLGSIEFEGFPAFTETLVDWLDRNGFDDGRRDLTTGSVAGFNAHNVPRLGSSGVNFNTIAADMDLNGNGRVDRNPDEFLQIRTEGDLSDNAVTTAAINKLYQILRKTETINVTYRDQCIPFTSLCRKIATLRSVDNATLLGNDTLVTIPSAQGLHSIQSLTRNSFTFEGASGRNHSNVANRGVAQRVLPWLFAIDREKGGLR